MLKIERFVCNMFGENAYVVSDATGECCLVDCGALYEEERQALRTYIEKEQLKPVALLCTHGHLDHIFGNGFICREYGIRPQVHADDAYLMTSIPEQAIQMIGMRYDEEVPPVGNYLKDGDTVHFGDHKLQVIHTPGHTPGGVVYYCEEEQVAFTGDTLFCMSIGRTDFPRGSFTQMRESLRLLAVRLPQKTALLTGHGQQTTMEYECRYNPYMRE